MRRRRTGILTLLLRMGINLGDIIVEPDGDIYGDGVNVAARLEQLASPGGLCISGSVYEHAEGKVSVLFESRGEQQVKNIARPVRVYVLAGAPRASTSRSRFRSPTTLNRRPALHEHEWRSRAGPLADGVVEESSRRCHVRSFFVISRNSSFTTKDGRSIRAKSVGNSACDTWSRAVSGNPVSRLRIVAQLIDATSGNQVWGERYEGDASDIFDLQDHVTEAVVGASSRVYRQRNRAREAQATRKPHRLRSDHARASGDLVAGLRNH